MPQARYIMIGGFLGAGKTTAILKLAQHLSDAGRTIGLITNDQSIDLVDTARARAAGFAVEEITGGCFCCKFDSLVEASQQLSRDSAPDVLIAEPVGSCTDLKATVSYPLRQLYGDQFRIAPLTVMVDPHRCMGVLGLSTRKKFSDKVVYVYRKQLEEAEVLVVNKAELLNDVERTQLIDALGREHPGRRVLTVSCETGEGLDEWFELIAAGDLGDAATMDVDYDEYAEGEALLGWYNAKGVLSADAAFDGDTFLLDLASRLNDRLSARHIEIAHLKMTLTPDEGPDMASVSLTRNDEKPRATHHMTDALTAGELMVNLRAEADPDLLKAQVLEELLSMPSPVFELRHVAAFRPGRPTPTHRVRVTPE